jgi:hypothetical protein
LPDHDQILPHGMDIMLTFSGLLIIRGGRRARWQHGLHCRGT